MRLKTTNKGVLPGSTRVVKRFAWLPVNIGGDWIWFEFYEVLIAFVGNTYTVVIDAKPVNFTKLQWIKLSKRMITR